MGVEPLKILVAAPLGQGGQGGIDRMMDAVRSELRRAPPPGLDIRFAPTRGQRSILLSPLVLTRFLAGMASWRPDLVHINLSADGSTYRKLVVAAWARRLGIPYILHLHSGSYPLFLGKAGPRLRRAIERMVAGATTFVVLGSVWRDFVLDQFPGTHVEILPNAVPPAALPPTRGTGPAHILFLGRLGPHKGTPELVEALGTLGGDWRATIAGDGDIEPTRTRAAALNLSDRISVPGWVGPDDLGRLLAEADLLVLPSHGENLPMSVIEAMAAGLPVVVTPVGAVPEVVVDGETGLLVPVGDVAALGTALGQLVTDSALRARMGAAGAEVHRTRLSIAPYVARLAEIWRAAIMPAGRSSRRR